MNLSFNRGTIEAFTATVGNLFAWLAGTEQIWFPLAGTYVSYVAPTVPSLPDLRGPFLFLTMCYAGLRIAEMLDKQDEIEGMQ